MFSAAKVLVEKTDEITEFVAVQVRGNAEDPVLSLRGLGKEIWAAESADNYVRRQRSGWQ